MVEQFQPPTDPDATVPAAPDPTGRRRDGLEKRFYRIGEVARITGVKPHVLRYWESEFRWMAPPKGRSQQRRYRPRDIRIIQLIKRLLHTERFTVAGARKRLREMGIDKALDSEELEASLLRDDPRANYRLLRARLSEIRAML